MNASIRAQLAQGKHHLEHRLNKTDNAGAERPMLTAANIDYEIDDRTRVAAADGLGALHLTAQKLGLAAAIDDRLHLLKLHLPYHESDHMLNIAYNLLAGGACLEHLELRRTDEFFYAATIEADGTMVETTGECKQGMDIILCAAYGETFLRSDATGYIASVYGRLGFEKMYPSGPRGV